MSLSIFNAVRLLGVIFGREKFQSASFGSVSKQTAGEVGVLGVFGLATGVSSCSFSGSASVNVVCTLKAPFRAPNSKRCNGVVDLLAQELGIENIPESLKSEAKGNRVIILTI